MPQSGAAVDGVIMVESRLVPLSLGDPDRSVASFSGAPSLRELARLSPAEYLARSVAAAQTAHWEGPLGRRAAPRSVDIVDVAHEGPDLAYVTVRPAGAEVEPDEEPERVALRRHLGAWRVDFEPGDFVAPRPERGGE